MKRIGSRNFRYNLEVPRKVPMSRRLTNAERAAIEAVIGIETFAVSTLRGIGPESIRPRLRFDKVVVQLLAHLHAAFAASVPDGLTLIVTVTAPIRLGSKTAAAIAERAATLRSFNGIIHGNQVMIRPVRHGNKSASGLIGYVHNPDGAAPRILFAITCALLKANPEEWLVLRCPAPSIWLGIFEAAFAQLNNAARIAILFSDGRVATLIGTSSPSGS